MPEIESSSSNVRIKSEPFYAVIDECKRLHDAKGDDYEGDGEVYANYRSISKWAKAIGKHQGLAPMIYALMRNEEKMNRVCSLLSGEDVKNTDESIEDTLKDMVVIPGIAIVLYREHKLQQSSTWLETCYIHKRQFNSARYCPDCMSENRYDAVEDGI